MLFQRLLLLPIQLTRMVQKKNIIKDLMLKYTGPFSIDDFYKELENWMREKGLSRELKRKLEDVSQKGKRLEYVAEMWKSIDDSRKHMVKIRALFDNVKELKMKKNKRNIRINQADVLITIDGWLETDLAGRWTQFPFFAFLSRVFDKYIWKILETNDAPIEQDCYGLHKRLKAFFELNKMKLK